MNSEAAIWTLFAGYLYIICCFILSTQEKDETIYRLKSEIKKLNKDTIETRIKLLEDENESLKKDLEARIIHGY